MPTKLYPAAVASAPDSKMTQIHSTVFLSKKDSPLVSISPASDNIALFKLLLSLDDMNGISIMVEAVQSNQQQLPVHEFVVISYSVQDTSCHEVDSIATVEHISVFLINNEYNKR